MATLTVQITDKEREAMRQIAERGDAMNVSDFVRQAIREKLARMEASQGLCE